MLHNKINSHFIILSFFLAVFFSCSPTSSSSGGSGSGGSPPETAAAVQLKSSLDSGITASGTGNEGDPFRILIDESYSLNTPSLGITDLFSNVESVVAGAGADEVSTALLNATQQTVETKLGSKLSIELSGSNGEKKYADLYFQDAARLTDAAQRGEAVLAPGKSGVIAKSDSPTDIVTVTLYKKSNGDPGSVKPLSLFNYDSDKFNVEVYKDADGNGQFSEAETIGLDDGVAESATVRLVFTPKEEGVDNKLLHPARSQILNIVTDERKISSLAFKADKWTDENLSSGDSPTEARLLEQAWNASFDLSSYVEKAEPETLTVKLHEADNLNIIPPAGGTVAENNALNPLAFAADDDTKYKFEITGESPFAIFEFSTADTDSIVGKKLYVKVNLTLLESIIDKADDINLTVTDAENPGDGLENSPYAFNVTKDQSVGISSELVKHSAGDLSFAVRSSTDSEFTALTANTTALRVSSGERAAGNLTAGEWVLRITDSGSKEYKSKALYFKLIFPLQSSSLSLVAAYKNGGDGSLEAPVVVKVPAAGITLANLTSPASLEKSLSYEVVTAGSGLTRGTTIDVSTNPILKIDDTVETATISRGSFVLKVSEEADDYREGGAFYFKLIFETESAELRAHADYANQNDKGKLKDAPIVVEIAPNANLTLADLIAPYSGTVTYSLEREGETSITLPSTTPLKVGEKFGSSEVLIAGDTDWTIKVSGTPPSGTEAEELYFQVTFAKAASKFGLVETLPNSRTASGNGEAYTTPFVISGSFAAETAVNLKTLVDETSASAVANLTYTTVTSANDQSPGSISNPAEALNTQVAGTSVVVRVVDSGSTTVAAKTIFLKLSFKTASSFALVATLPDDRIASGNGEAYATPFVISGSFAAETAVNLKTLVDETSASAAANLTYTTVTSANDQSPGSISNPAEALNTQVAGTSVVVRVVDSGSTTVAAKTIFLKLSFKTASSFALVATLPDDRIASGNGETYATPFVISGSFAAETAVNLKTLVDETSASAAANLTYTTVTSANDQSPGSISNPAEALNTQVAGTSVVVRVVDSGSTTVAAKTIFLKLSFKTASSFALVATLPDDRIASGNGETYATPFVISGSFAAETAVNLKTLVDETSASAAANLTYTTVTSANDQSPGSISNPAEALNTQVAGTSVVVRVVDSGSTTVAAKTIFLKLSFKTASSFALVATLPDDRIASGNGEAYATPFVISGSFAAETAVNLKTLVDETSASAAANLTYTTVTSANDQSPGSISNPAEALNTQVAGTSVVVRVVDSGSTTVAAKTIFLKLSFKTASSFALVATLPDDRIASGNGETYATPFVISGSFAAETAVNLKTLVDETSASAAANLTYTTVTSANDQSPGSISNPAEALNTQVAGTSVVVRVVDSGSTTVAAKTIFLKLSFKTASSFALVATLPDDRIASGNGEAYATPFVISGSFAAETAVNLKTLVDETSASAAANLTYTTVTSANDQSPGSISNPAEALNTQVAGTSVVVRVVDSGSTTVAAKTIFLKLSFKTASSFALVATLPDDRIASGNGETYATPFVISGSFAAETAVNLKTLVDETSASAAANLTYTTVTSANDQSPGSISNPAEALNTQVAGTSVVVRVVDSGSTTVAAKTIFLKLSFKTASSFALVATLPDDRIASGNGETYATPFVISGSFAAETAVNLKTLVDETSASAAANLTYTTVTSANDQSPGSISNPAEALNTQVAGTSVVVRVVDSGSTTVAAKTIFLKLSFKTASSFALVATLPDDRIASGNGETYATPFVISGSFAAETAVNLKTLVDETSASAAANLTYTTVTSANDQSPGSISNPAEALNTQVAGTSVVVRVVDSGSTTVAAKTIFLKLSFKTASSFALVATLPDDRIASGNGEAYATPFVISGSFAAETAVNLKTLVDETSASAAANLTYTTVTSANDQSPGSISNPAEALNTQVAGTSVVVRVVDSGSTTVAAKTIFLKLSFKTASSFALVATLPDDRTASGNGEAYATPFVISGSFAAETAVNLKTLVDETSASAAANLTYTTVTSANDQSPGSISNPAEALNTQVAGTSVVVRVVDSGSTTVAAKTIFLKLSFKTASSFALVATLPDDRTASGNGEAYATPFVISGSFAAETAVNLKTLVDETSASAAANLTYTTVTSANDQSPGSISNPAEALNTQVAGTSVVVRVVDSGSTTVAAKTIFLKLSFKTASSFALVATLPDDRTASGNGEAYATPFVISGSFAAETAVNLKTLVDETSASAAANLTYTTVTSANDQSPGSISNPAEALNTQVAGTSVVVRVVDSGSTTVAAKTIFLKLSFKTASSFALVATLPDDRTASGNGEAYATPFVISGSFAAETAVNLKTLVDETSASAAANLTYTTVTSANDQSPGSISNPAEALNTQVAGTSVVVRVVDSGSTTVAAKTIFLKLSFKTASSFALVATLPDDRTASGNGEAYATPFVISGSFAAETAVNLKTLVDETSASAAANLTYTTVTSANDQSPGSISNPAEALNTQVAGTSVVVRVVDSGSTTVAAKTIFLKLSFKTASSFALVATLPDDRTASGNGEAYATPFVISGSFAAETAVNLKTLVDETSASAAANLTYTTVTSANDQSPGSISNPAEALNTQVAGTSVVVRVVDSGSTTVAAKTIFLKLSFKTASSFALVATLPDDRTASGNGEAYATPFVISGSFAAETAVNLKTLVDETSASAAANLTYTTVTSANDQSPGSISNPAEALNTQVAGTSVVVRVVDSGSTTVAAKTIFLKLSFKTASSFALVATLPDDRTASGNGEAYATPFVISGSFAAETAVNLKTLVDETSASAAANLTYTTVTSANDQSPGSISNPAEALNTQVAGTSVVVRVVDSGSTTVAAKTIFLKLSFKTASSFALVATLPDDRTASGNGETYATPFVISGSFAAETAVNLKTLVDETSASAAANLTYTTVTSANDQSPGSISNPVEALNTQVAGTSVVVRVVDSGSTTVAAKTIFLKLSFKTASSFALVATLPDDRTASGNGEAYATPFVISGSFAAETAVNLKTLVDETSASAAANLTYTTVTSANDQSPGSISNPVEALNTQVAGTSVVVRVVDSGSTTVAAKTIFLKLSFKTASSFALVATLPDDRTASGNGETYATPFVISGSFAAETAVNLKTLVDETSASAAANLTYTTVTSANDQSPGSISNPAEALNTQVAGTSVVVRVVDSGSTTVAAKTIFLKLSFKTASSFALVATLPDDRTASGNGETYATPFVISGSFAAETAVNLKTLVDETSASAAANLTYTTVTSANDQSPGSISNPAEALNTQVAGTSVVVRVVDSGSTTVAAKTIFLKLSFKTASSFALVATLPDDRTASGNGETYATPFVISGSFAAETAVNLKTLVDETSASAAANLTYTTVTSANDQSPGSISNPAEALNTQVAGTSVVVRVVDSGSTTVAAKTIFLKLSFKTASSFALVATLPDDRTASGNGEAYATPFVISGSFAAETAVNLKTLVDETSASAAANLTYTTVTSANDQSPGSISNPAEALNTQVAGTSVVVRVVDSGSTTVAAKTIFLKLSFKTASSFALVATLPDDRTASGNGETYATPFVISGSFAAETAVNLKTLVDETSASAAANLTYTTVTSANDQSPGSISNPAEALNTQVAGTSVVVRVVDSGSTTVAAKTIFLKLSFKTASSFALVATLPDDRTASGNGETYATPFVISGSFAAETAVNLKTLVDETSASAAANLTYTTVTSANDQSPGSISNPAEALNTQVAGTSVVVRVVDSGSTTVAAKTIFLKLSFKTASSFALVATLPDDRTASGNGEAYATPFVISGSFAAETAVNLKTLVDETSASAAANLTYTTVTSANDQSPGSISNPAEALNTQVAGTSVVVRVVDSGSTTVAAKTIFLKLSFKTASSFALVATLPDDRTASGNGETYATPFVISGSFAAETAVNLKTLVDETSASAAANLTYTTVTSANDQSPGSISNPAEALNTQVAGTSVVVRVVDSGSTTVAAKTIFLKLSFKTASSFALVATLPDDRTASGNGEAYATPFVISGSFAAETAVNLKTLVDETSASAAANLTYTTVTSANDQSPGSISNPAEALNTQVAGTSVVVRVVDSGSTTVAAKTIFLKLSFKTASSFALVATLPDDRTASGNGEAYATPFVISGSFAAETAVNLKTLVDETSASAAANLTYTTVTSANDQSPGSISNPAEALNTQVAGTSVVVRVVDSGSTTVAAKTIFLKLSFKTASSFALVATLPDDRTASGNGETYATPFVISGSFAAETAVNLKTLVDETSASAAANLTYTTVTSANDQSPGSISNPAEALNTQVAGTSVVVRVVDSGSTTVAAKTIFLKLSFKTASSFALVATLPDDRTASGNGETYATPFVISGSFAAETAVNLKTLVDETSASAAANLTYTTVTSANDQSPGSISNPAEALNTQVAGTSVVVRVVDSGSTTVAAKTIFLKLSFKTASSFALVATLPDDRTASGNGETYATPFVISGSFAAETAVNLKTLVDETSASAAANLTYTIVTSADEDEEGTPIANARLANQAGKSVVVRVVDSGSTTVASNTLYLSLAFATVPPTQDNRYTAVALRSGGPEVQLTGGMTAGKISFSVELLPNTAQVIYSSGQGSSEFKYLYRDFDGDGDDYDLVLFVSGTGDVSLKSDLPAGIYNFSLVKALSNNGYTVALSVTDSNDQSISFDSNSLTNNNIIEITNNNVQAFSNPVIGADANASNRRPVRVVNNVQWAFQPAAPQVSLLGGDDFSALTTGASVGSTFVVRVADLVTGDEFELFSATNDQTSSRNQIKTVGTGETSLEFEVSGLTHGTVYEFLVKPADSSANLLDSPASVTVTVDTSVRETRASFPVTQGSRVNGLAGMSVTPVDPTADAFEVGDRIFLYEINADNERVAVGSATGLAHTFTTENLAQYSDTTVNPFFPALGVNLSNISFEERAYALVVEVVTPLGNKADSNFTFLIPEEPADRVFDITFDFTPPQLSFDFSDASNLVISANNEALAADLKADIESGLTFTDAQGNSLSITPTATYRTGSFDYEVSLSPALSAGAVLNLAAGTVRDVAGNGNIRIEEDLLPSLLNVVASSNRIDASSTSTILTFNFAQEIDASTFTAADLKIVDVNNIVVSGSALTFDNISPNAGASQTIDVTLTAPSGFDNQVYVKIKDDNEISLPGISLAAPVEGESPLIDIDRKAPTPTVTFPAAQVAPSAAVQFTLSFDEAVTGDIENTDFTAAAGGSVTNINRTDDRTFTGTLTTPSTATEGYLLSLKADVVADTYGNNNNASAATINVVDGAVPLPSFSAPPLARHGGSTTLTISFPVEVTGFAVGDLSVTDAGGATNTVTLGDFPDTATQVYTVTLSTQNNWTSGAVTVTVEAGAYQDSSGQGNSPTLSYTIPVSNVLSTPTLVSVTDSTTTVSSSDTEKTLPLSGISVKVNVSAVKDDTLLLFLGGQMVATHTITTTGTATIDITDPSSKVNGSRLAYSVRLQDAQGNLSSVSRLLYVSFDDPSAATAPEISGPVSNASFTDDFSFGESNWAFRHGKAVGINQPSTLPGSAEINNGVLQLNDARTWQYALVTQNDLIFSTQGRVVFEATFIFGNTQDPADGIAFFSYDARDELFYSGRGYSGNGDLVVTNGRLRSLFFAIGLYEYQKDRLRYAPPAANPADLSDLANPTGGNESGWDNLTLDDEIWSNARHRLRITVENRSVLVERANVDTNGVVDESSWSTMLQRSFPDTAYIPDNIKIGFSSATGAARNYHAVDDVSVNAELFVPYTVGATPVQASPSGVTLTAGEKTDSSTLAISGIRVRINSGYQTTDSLTFSGDSTLFTPTLSSNTLTIRSATGQSPSTEDFLAALNAIRFSATAAGERTLSWQVFAKDAEEEVPSQFYNSEIRVFPN